MGHVSGTSRYQRLLLGASLDEQVAGDHQVRVIDAFVDALDLAGLGFEKVAAEATGRPPYHPGDLLKLYLYGYANQMRSSRRLERECRRNIEVRWLIDEVTPSFKTIADFRRDHPLAIVASTGAFVRFCRSWSLYGAEVVAIDGTKIEAVASSRKVLTPKRLEKQMAATDRRIAEYLAAMDEADEAEASQEGEPSDVAAALAALREQREQIAQTAKALVDEGLTQKVVGEEDAKLMKTARHGYQVAYNAQIAVDAEHGLIAAFDLTNAGNDKTQLLPMARTAQEALQAEALTVVADTGYSNGEQGQALEAAGVTPVVPAPRTPNPKNPDLFTRDAFAYDKASDSYTCPAGETLSLTIASRTEQKFVYAATACAGCELKPKCTKASRREITRGFHEDARQAMHQRALDRPDLMKQRRCLAEHPFGVIKQAMGRPSYLVRGLKKAKAELAIDVLAFNLKRAIHILGAETLIGRLRPA